MTRSQRLAQALWAELQDEDCPVTEITLESLERIAAAEPDGADDVYVDGVLDRAAIELNLEDESGERPRYER